MKKLIIPFALLVGSCGVVQDRRGGNTVINAAAINSTQYTGWISMEGRTKIAFEIAYTYSAATAVTMTCESSMDGTEANGSGFDIHTVETPVGGTATTRPLTLTNPVSASENYVVVWEPGGNYINCAFDGTGADGSDLITVQVSRHAD